MPHATIAPARKNRVRRPVLARARAGAVRPGPAPARTVMPLWQALLPGGAATTAGARP
ncbi:hypothetical protein G9272_23520 [Streptomyces asoensis]|uniref:Uncharacterized protein n=1 Tax=Streptomyces asoensis TaxID=249586 RepID=A0A6M4X401_9ACTN|nr:hypothetical protein [Streptomyces asoensis]QJT02893.1 hypothetical protein G9272_23520 [Streptomyces asoensis]